MCQSCEMGRRRKEGESESCAFAGRWLTAGSLRECRRVQDSAASSSEAARDRCCSTGIPKAHLAAARPRFRSLSPRARCSPTSPGSEGCTFKLYSTAPLEYIKPSSTRFDPRCFPNVSCSAMVPGASLRARRVRATTTVNACGSSTFLAGSVARGWHDSPGERRDLPAELRDRGGFFRAQRGTVREGESRECMPVVRQPRVLVYAPRLVQTHVAPPFPCSRNQPLPSDSGSPACLSSCALYRLHPSINHSPHSTRPANPPTPLYPLPPSPPAPPKSPRSPTLSRRTLVLPLTTR